MKKSSPLLFALLFGLLACNDASTPDPAADGWVLAAILHESGDQQWQETFEYDNNGRLISREDERTAGHRITYQYEGDLLVERQTIDPSNGTLIFRDSITYNAQNLIDRVYRFSINQGNQVPLSDIRNYRYNAQGQLAEVSTEYVNLSDYQPRHVYHWQDGNVVQVDRFNGDCPMIEFYYTYDKQPVVFFEGWNGLDTPEVKTRNNIISTDWTDFTGLLDTACKPCTQTFSYFPNGLPRSVSFNWDYSMHFSYITVPEKVAD